MKFCSPQKSRKFYEEDPDATALEIGIDLQSELLGSVQQAFTPADDDSLFEDCVLCRQPICEELLRQSPWAAYCVTCDPRYSEQDLCLELSQAA